MRFGLPRGGPRLARHLWRMCFALFIAAGSFFPIRARVAKILSGPFTTAPMRALPILLFGAMFFWCVPNRYFRDASEAQTRFCPHSGLTDAPQIPREMPGIAGLVCRGALIPLSAWTTTWNPCSSSR
jgi:hypothetical protein